MPLETYSFFFALFIFLLSITRTKRESFIRLAYAAGLSGVSLTERCGLPVATIKQCSSLVHSRMLLEKGSAQWKWGEKRRPVKD